ncbi:hypothetical protein MJL33_33310, partial [Salmonella enterica subsp. enterica serovar Kentucky]|nr:hypothetical protein [Salmonella enterica subsp. enterica serovar Kentucky]
IQAILNDVCHCRDQLLHVTGLNRELVLTDLILRIEHYLQPGTQPCVIAVLYRITACLSIPACYNLA